MDFLGGLASIFAKLFGLIANIGGTITGAFLGVSVLLFNWVTSDEFISLSYTQLDNPFIEIGWTLTRDLTNIFFVIALIAIGLGTALRRTGYQAQKALPTLVIIALLINFTPVILGLIVDASNIVMNFFLKGGFAGSASFANYATSQWSNMSVFFDLGDFWNPTKNIAAAAASIILMGFNLMATIVYALFAFLFIFRYLAIWTLVILSPFAFASYILPATRQVWTMWWKQFIQWSIFGIIAAFFLYLGDHFIRIASSNGFLEGSMEEIANAPGLAPIIGGILPYFISIGFLFIGLFLSLTFSPQGASSIIKWGQGATKRAGILTGKGYLRAIKGLPGAPKRAAEGARGIARGIRSGREYATTRAAQRRITRGAERPISPGLIMEEGMEAEELRTRVTRPTVRQRVGRIREGAKEVAGAVGVGLRESGVEKRYKSAHEGLKNVVNDIWKAGKAASQKKDEKKDEKKT